jgi:hypothetical protein
MMETVPMASGRKRGDDPLAWKMAVHFAENAANRLK